MSTQTNNAYVTKSLNGIISIDDGAGGTMEGGVITANELIIDEIQSKSPPNVVSLFTDTTTIINMGSSTSTLNVSNLNVSNINLPVITFTTLNVSNANSSISNSSTSNSSTSNSSTSNSSTSNSSISNSSVSNSDIANNGTTNSTTSNASTSNSTTSNTSTINTSTANNETTNTSTINVSTSNGTSMYMDNIYTNNIQNISTANVSLYTGYSGNIFMGNISTNLLLIDSKNTTISSVNDTTITAGGEIYLNSNGNTEICNSGFTGKMILSGSQEIRAKDRSMPSYLFTDSFTGGNLTIANLSSIVTLNSEDFNATANDRLTLTSFDMSLNALGNLYMYGQSARINDQTESNAFLGYTVIGANASRATIQANGRDDLLLGCISTAGQVYIGGSGTLNATTINASTYNASTFNASTINASTYNATNINASSIITGELYSDYSELGNITFTNDTINTLAPTSTIGLFPALTTGIVNLATNGTNSAVNIGNSADVGSFSLSNGTININPKTTLNVANQIGTGNVNICNANTFNGVVYIANTTPTSGANIINMGSTSTTININSFQTTITSSRDYTMNAGSGFNIRYNRAQIPVSVPYSANTGTNVNGSVGRIMVGTITIANGTNLPDNGNNQWGNITNLEVGVWVVYSKIGVNVTSGMTLQRQGSYITDTAGFVVSETKYMGTSAGSAPVGVYWYENCATYSCFTTTTLRLFISIDFGAGVASASTANNRFTATRIA